MKDTVYTAGSSEETTRRRNKHLIRATCPPPPHPHPHPPPPPPHPHPPHHPPHPHPHHHTHHLLSFIFYTIFFQK